MVVVLANCATAPVWVNRLDNPPEDPYWRAAGSGATRSGARHDAFMRICAKIHGTEIEEVSRSYDTARASVLQGRVGAEEEFFLENWITENTKGKVPERTRVVEYYQKDKEYHAYAVVERMGMEKIIKRELRLAKKGNAFRSSVPGWSQFGKRETRKGVKFIVGVATGLVGGMVFKMQKDDALRRRDSAPRKADVDYYNSMANRYYWASSGFFTIAAASYLGNVLDGLFTRPKGYQIVAEVAPGRVQLALKL
jgi:hypothetical protein